MISTINIIILFLWVASAFVDYNDFCYTWQLKEYRWDRMRDFMSTMRGKEFWKKYIILWRSLFVIFIFFWPINSVLLVKYFLIAVLASELIRNFVQFGRKKIKHPVFTKKSILIIFTAIVVEGLLFVFSKDWPMFFLLMSIRFFIISLVVLILYMPTNFVKKIIIKKAARKLSKYKDLKIVGITGSYGKSSVKNFLSTILSTKFKVVKTPKNINTEIGVAKFILSTDFNDVEVFVVEMGAYCKGEIKLICDMVKPSIGILTAITEQHIALFGNIKKTQSAKYELLRSLPKSGLAVVNSDNKYCREYLGELECKVSTFGVENEYNPDFLINSISKTTDGISFSGKIYGQNINIQASVPGVHNAKNIAPCYIVANFLNVPLSDAIAQSMKLNLPKNVLSIIKYGEVVVLDDSYNSNYDGFCSGIDMLNNYSDRKKIVITRGIPELGKMSEEIHTKIGGEIAYLADELIIISRDNAEALKNGVGARFQTKVRVVEDPTELLQIVKLYKNTKSAILLENRVPDVIIKEINKR